MPQILGKRTVAVLCVDVVSSVKMAANIKTEINNQLHYFVESLDHNEVFVRKVSGDGLLLAAYCGLVLVKAAFWLKKHFVSTSTETIRLGDVQMRFGAALGSAIVKSVNGNKDLDIDGDVAEIATRIEQSGFPGVLHCDLDFALNLFRDQDNDFDIIPLGRPLELKDFGRRELFQIKGRVGAIPFKVGDEAGRGVNDQLRIVRNLLCYHQGEILQYWCISSWYHRDLKSEMNRRNKNLPKIKELYDLLLHFMTRNTQRVCQETFKLLEQYFEQTRDSDTKLPRICLKVITDNNGSEHALDVYRNSGSLCQQSSKIKDNAGFQHITTYGEPFLCNDIPTLLKNGVDENVEKYWNPRLNLDKAKGYDNVNGTFDEWVSCWDNASTEPGSAYRSTLIVPITLANNHLSSEFMREFAYGDGELDRQIYGYLCLDHVDKDYFTPSNGGGDLDVGFIVADLLSLYLLSQINYSEGSHTFGKATILLNKNNLL